MEDDFDDGWDMTARLVDGRWVERSPRGAEAEPKARRQAQFLPWLAPQLPLPVPVPAVVAEQPLVLRHEYLPGERCPGDSAAHGAAIGHFLTVLHRIDAAEAVAHGLPDAASSWADTVETFNQLGNVVLPLLPASAQPGGRAVLGRLSMEPSRMCVVHADLGLDHIRVTGELVTGVIDWGDSQVGDPALDLSAVVNRAGPEFGAGVVRVYRPDDGLLARSRDWYRLSPWHDVVFGLDTHDGGFVERAVAEAVARL